MAIDVDKSALKAIVENFFLGRNLSTPGCCSCSISLDSDLWETGYITSLTFLDLILFLEQTLQVNISMEAYVGRHFRTIEGMYDALMSAQTREPAA